MGTAQAMSEYLLFTVSQISISKGEQRLQRVGFCHLRRASEYAGYEIPLRQRAASGVNRHSNREGYIGKFVTILSHDCRTFVVTCLRGKDHNQLSNMSGKL